MVVVRQADWADEGAALQAVRHAVFVTEQGVDPALEQDGLDARCHHVVALDGARAVGTARVAPGGKIGRVAVLRGWRGRGIGTRMVRALVEIARAAGYPEVALHAQQHSLEFYRRLGFVPEGAPFEEAGIPHRAMRLHLGD